MSDYQKTPAKSEPIIIAATPEPLTPEQLNAEAEARRELGTSIMAQRIAEQEERTRRTAEINARALEREQRERAEAANRKHWESVHKQQAQEKREREFREMVLEAVALNVKLAAILRGGLNGCEVEVTLLRQSIAAIESAIESSLDSAIKNAIKS